jgi:hypothetical protein
MLILRLQCRAGIPKLADGRFGKLRSVRGRVSALPGADPSGVQVHEPVPRVVADAATFER